MIDLHERLFEALASWRVDAACRAKLPVDARHCTSGSVTFASLKEAIERCGQIPKPRLHSHPCDGGSIIQDGQLGACIYCANPITVRYGRWESWAGGGFAATS